MQTTINPLSGFWTIQNKKISNVDQEIIIDLYQPILGPIAVSIYFLLINEAKKNLMMSERKNHMHLFTLLDCGGNDFYQARIRLEALGLIRTFEKSDSLGDFNIYEIMPPLSASDFFKETLLSTMLFEKISEENFEELVDKYKNKEIIFKDAKEVTLNFLDVFTISESNILKTPEIVKQSQLKTQTLSPQAPKIDDNVVEQLDWSFLAQTVSRYNVTEKDINDNQELLANLHMFYGLDELELSNLIAKTADRSTDKIDGQSLERTIQKQYEKRSNIVEKPVESHTKVVSSSDDPLIKAAETMIPSEFLAYEKRKMNGFVGSSETSVLRQLQQRNVLNLQVINILIHYVLQNSPTLSKGFVETVANDWAQNNVKTAQDALNRIEEFNNIRIKGNRKKVKVEQGSNWDVENSSSQKSNNENEALLKKQAADELAKLRRQIKEN